MRRGRERANHHAILEPAVFESNVIDTRDFFGLGRLVRHRARRFVDDAIGARFER